LWIFCDWWRTSKFPRGDGGLLELRLRRVFCMNGKGSRCCVWLVEASAYCYFSVLQLLLLLCGCCFMLLFFCFFFPSFVAFSYCWSLSWEVVTSCPVSLSIFLWFLVHLVLLPHFNKSFVAFKKKIYQYNCT
jgi:hypothetical protein